VKDYISASSPALFKHHVRQVTHLELVYRISGHR